MRHHRLLELYLAEHLGVPWDRVHEEAEALEHVISEDLEARIAAKLGEPTHDPHGDPIPSRRPPDRRGRLARAGVARGRRDRALRPRVATRTRRCCATSTSAASASATSSRSSTASRSAARSRSASAATLHTLGGGLAARDARRARLQRRAVAIISAMPDYGHDLTFGTFITPQAQRPDDVVALAQLTERGGPGSRDLPGPPVPAGVPRHVDAAVLGRRADRDAARRAERPQPARSASRPCSRAPPRASTCSSGGRVELGLGAGAFWDGIEAMGGERLTPGESVDALERGDRRHPRHLGRRPSAAACASTASTTACAAPSAGPAPAHDIEHVARRLQAAHAAADRAQGRRLAARRWPTCSRTTSRRQPHDRRGGRGGRPRPARDPPPAQHPGRVRPVARRLPPGPARAVGRGAARAGARARLQHVHPERRRPAARSRCSARTSRPRCARRWRASGRAPAPRPARSAARPRSRRAAPGSTTTRCPRRSHARPSSPAIATTRKVRSTYIRPARRGSCIRREDETDVAAALAYARDAGRPAGGPQRRARHQRALDQRRRHRDRPRRAGRDRGARPGDRPRPARAGRALGRRRAGARAARAGDELGRLRRRRRRRARHRRRRRLPRAQVRPDDRPRRRPPSSCSPTGRSCAPTPSSTPTCSGPSAAPAQLRHRHRVRARRLRARRRRLLDRWRRRARPAPVLERWAAVVEAAPRELTSFLTVFAQRGGEPRSPRLYSVYAGDDTAAAAEALTPLLARGPLLDQQAQLVPYAAVVPPHGGPHDRRRGAGVPARDARPRDAGVRRRADARSSRSGDAPMMQLPLGRRRRPRRRPDGDRVRAPDLGVRGQRGRHEPRRGSPPAWDARSHRSRAGST